MSLAHGRAVRMLLLQVPPSAIALLRPQYEALVRAVWARYSAPERELARLLAPLTRESEHAARKLPGLADMLAAIDASGPEGAGALLRRARHRLWDGLNSFVHGGIHPYQRWQEGYPLKLLGDVLKNANALSLLTLPVLAEVTEDAQAAGLANYLHKQFEEGLAAARAAADLNPLVFLVRGSLGTDLIHVNLPHPKRLGPSTSTPNAKVVSSANGVRNNLALLRVPLRRGRFKRV